MRLVWMHLISDSPKMPFNLPEPGPGLAPTGSAESHCRMLIPTLRVPRLRRVGADIRLGRPKLAPKPPLLNSRTGSYALTNLKPEAAAVLTLQPLHCQCRHLAAILAASGLLLGCATLLLKIKWRFQHRT